jgi:putrescine:ornithine antiporter
VAQTGKAAADDRMFPAIFSRVNGKGAPVAGMIVLGIVQTLLALMTISPTLNEQFGALVNLSVVTNVIPYIVALSALPVMMRNARVTGSKFTITFGIALLAMLYSSYAVFASGGSAVIGGVLVMCAGYIVWGIIAPRFIAKQKSS